MTKPLNTITRAVHVGIYDSEDVARVYADKIVVIRPYVRWVGNTGGYAERKTSIRDPEIIAEVLADLADGSDDSAWDKIVEF